MFTQALNVDIATISKSAKGRVLFFDADGVCVLGLSETAQIQMQFDSGFLYVIQDGGGTGLFSQGSVTNVPMAFNCSFYKFTVMGLTDIDGRPFTAMPTVDFNQEDYLAKAREAYEYLVTNVFVGCCNTGTDSILWYADEASFPATGLVNTLYVDKATPALFIWNGTDYVAIAGGSGGAYIPLAGTVSGNPVTGAIEGGSDTMTMMGVIDKSFYVGASDANDIENAAYAAYNRYSTDGLNHEYRAATFSANGAIILTLKDDNGSPLALISCLGALESVFNGLEYNADYSANFVLRSLIDQEVLKKRIWTKAGTPTTTDDSTEGYIVGSLLWDTTNSILYKCTDNSTGAAVWELAIKTKLIELIRTGAGVPSSSTRYATEGLAGLSAGIVVTICPNALFTTFRVFITSAQPASGSLTVKRNFYNVAGTLTDTQSLVIAAGSAAGIYTYSGAAVDRTAVDGSYGIEIINAATSTSGSVNSTESIYYI